MIPACLAETWPLATLALSALALTAAIRLGIGFSSHLGHVDCGLDLFELGLSCFDVGLSSFQETWVGLKEDIGESGDLRSLQVFRGLLASGLESVLDKDFRKASGLVHDNGRGLAVGLGACRTGL